MSLKDKLKSASNWTAALLTAGTLQAGNLQAQPTADDDPKNAQTEHLDSRVKQGALINGKTSRERNEYFQKIKAEKGEAAFKEAVYNEDLKTLEIPQKTENGYTIEKVYYENNKHSKSLYESYYPNGVLASRAESGSEKAEGYYPDGSKKFDRTADGITTTYHPGGKKGEEKIKETPHGIYDAYDVLDIQGRRTEHHHAVQDSNTKIGSNTFSLKDVKTVDLYNPETKKLEATYTLDDWGIGKGRLARIGMVDKNGEMKTIDFPNSNPVQRYVSRLTTKSIQKLYDKNQQKDDKGILKKAISDKLSANR